MSLPLRVVVHNDFYSFDIDPSNLNNLNKESLQTRISTIIAHIT